MFECLGLNACQSLSKYALRSLSWQAASKVNCLASTASVCGDPSTAAPGA